MAPTFVKSGTAVDRALHVGLYKFGICGICAPFEAWPSSIVMAFGNHTQFKITQVPFQNHPMIPRQRSWIFSKMLFIQMHTTQDYDEVSRIIPSSHLKNIRFPESYLYTVLDQLAAQVVPWIITKSLYYEFILAGNDICSLHRNYFDDILILDNSEDGVMISLL